MSALRYPEPVFTFARHAVGDVRHHFGALFVCLWLLDEHGRPSVRIADPEIPPGAGVAATSSMIAAHIGATRLPVTPLGVRIRYENQTLAFLEIDLEHGDALAIGEEIIARTDTLGEALAAGRTLAAVEAPPRGKVLIVDDDEGIRRLLSTVLKRERFQVIEASNGLVGQHLASAEQPDLIIMDWTMPLMDGREATLRMKSDPKTVAIPIVMLTSRSHVNDRVLALETGVQDFMTKPFDRRELIAHLERLLRWRNLLSSQAADKLHALAPAVAEVAAVAPSVVPSIGTEPVQREAPVFGAPVAATQDPKASMEEALAKAEEMEHRGNFADAAEEYHRAAEYAARYVNPDVANKLHRLAGKMYLSWAESATDAADIQRAYAAAARAFLGAGNLKLAKKSADNAKLAAHVEATAMQP